MSVLRQMRIVFVGIVLEIKRRKERLDLRQLCFGKIKGRNVIFGMCRMVRLYKLSRFAVIRADAVAAPDERKRKISR